jgi:4-hydroxybutyryl-CoA dehydratase/vinylacetyl-CoA-Delta-isomerase
MPLEADYLNPETRPLIEKYFKGKASVPTEDRLKLLYFIQELTASRFGGYFLSSAICAVGTPETNRLEVMRNYDLKLQIDNVKDICGINS